MVLGWSTVVLYLCFGCSLATRAFSVEQNCLTDSEAKHIGRLWTQLIGNYTTSLAQNALVPNYTDYSASALSLNKVCPQAPHAPPSLLDPVFHNRTQFEEGQGSQPPIKSKILQVWHGCHDVTMRYVMETGGSGSNPVVGIIAIEVVRVSHLI